MLGLSDSIDCAIIAINLSYCDDDKCNNSYRNCDHMVTAHAQMTNTCVIVEVRSEVRKCAKVMASPEAGKVELLPLEGATSGVWRYFGFPSKEGKFVEPDKNKRTSVHCKLCTKVLKYAGNTTNLRYHLEHSHRAEFQALQLAQASEKEAGRTRTALIWSENIWLFLPPQFPPREHLVQLAT